MWQAREAGDVELPDECQGSNGVSNRYLQRAVQAASAAAAEAVQSVTEDTPGEIRALADVVTQQAALMARYQTELDATNARLLQSQKLLGQLADCTPVRSCGHSPSPHAAARLTRPSRPGGSFGRARRCPQATLLASKQATASTAPSSCVMLPASSLMSQDWNPGLIDRQQTAHESCDMSHACLMTETTHDHVWFAV